MDQYDEKQAVLEAQLKPQLTAEWLETLVTAAQTCGWMVDFWEVKSFVYWCFDVADAEEHPSLEPFQDA